ncbi:MAG TPA: arabinan endo-1,5-alpha-L-arabinosidase [Polyangia bacterium]
MTRITGSSLVILVGVLGIAALSCNSAGQRAKSSDDSGNAGGGGNNSQGGSNSQSSGGTSFGGAVGGGGGGGGEYPATGSTTSTGGATATAGTTGGGGTSAGGNAATGGIAASGGSKLPGGATAAGGATGTGGVNGIGGVIGTGGTIGTGGASGTGGATGTGGAPGTGGTAGAGGTSSTCAIASYDAAKPPQALTLNGNLGTHDPSVILANGTYYLFATGNGISTKTSTDMLKWTATPDVFPTLPAWVAGQISGVTNIWAPDISFFGGQYHLYYAVSTFGSNKSCIGHATRASLGAGAWADHGSVICSNVGTSDNWNAIDPNVIVDDAGTPWLDFGSFWSGVKMVKLDATGARADTQMLSIANNKSIEAPYIIHQCGYYYLFVSFGSCCGSPYDYNIRVGRSTSVTGPYADKAGTAMTSGGGTLLVQGNTTWTAPGHNAVIVAPSATYNVYHALDAGHANATLRVSQLVLDSAGWPISGGP